MALRTSRQYASVLLLVLLGLAVTQPCQAVQLQQNSDAALVDAVWKGDKDTARKLLDTSANPNARDVRYPYRLPDKYKPLTVLMIAAYRADLDLVKLLVERGASVNARGSTDAFLFCADATPLMAAVGGMRLLGSIDRISVPTLAQLQAKVKRRYAIVQYLLAHGAEVNAVDALGETALMDAANPGDNDTLEAGDASLIGLLLDRGAHLEAHDTLQGYTALMHAVQAAVYHGRKDNLKLLAARGANVNARTNNWETPLMLAIQDVSTVRLLLDRGAEVRTINKQGWTVLMFAVQENNMESVRLLLAHGADVNHKAVDGQTALKLAKGKKALVALLRKAGAKE